MTTTEELIKKTVDNLVKEFSSFLKTFTKNQYIFYDFNDFHYVGIVIKGRVIEKLISKHGEEKTYLNYRQYQMFGNYKEIVKISRSSFAISHSTTQILLFPEKIFIKLLESREEIKILLYHQLLIDVNKLGHKFEVLNFESANKRFVSYLIRMSDIYNSTIINATVEEIGQNISTTRQTIHKMIKTLTEINLIEKKYSRIRILDKEKLITLRDNLN